MIKEALQYIVGISHPVIHSIDGLNYSDKPIHPAKPLQPEPIRVETLAALVSLVTMPLDSLDPSQVYAHVVSPIDVVLASTKADEYGQRRVYARAVSAGTKFDFEHFHEPEAFVIGLQCGFVDDTELKKLLSVVSSLTAENMSIAEDDGISQTATVRQGIALKNRTKIEPKVRLRPYRTFREPEVDQPPSQFLFRLRNRDGFPPSCALFEADGGAWRIEAVENVAGWLTEYLPKTVKVVY